MSFESRFLHILQIACISIILIASLDIAVIQYNQMKGGEELVVKALPSVVAAPNVKFIPAANKSSFNADISNAVINQRAKQPVIISL